MPGSIRPKDWFQSHKGAEKFRESVIRYRGGKDTIVRLMGYYTNEEMQKIATVYDFAYHRDLSVDLKSEFTGDCEEMVLALMTPTRKYDARELNRAIAGAGTDETAIIEILCTKSNAEIEQIKEEYQKEFGTDLEGDLTGDTSGYFQRLLVPLLAAGRETDELFVDYERAMEDAQKFYDAGEARWGTEEAELNAILCLRSYSQLIETFKAFSAIAGKTIEESIEDECSGSMKDGYLAIVQSVKDKPGFFARRLHETMAGVGKDDSAFIRIVVSRSEIDMEEIKEAFQEKYKRSLEEAIESEYGGYYKIMLIAIVKTPDE